MPQPVDIYIRISRVGGREHLISPDEQEARARAEAKTRGLIVGEVVTDLDESGGKWDRPGLQRALERVKDGKSGGLIVAWLDRLSRDSEHAHRLVREIDEAGGAIYAPDAPADWTTPEGELQVGIMFVFAAYVRKRSAAGFERAKAQSVAAGIPIINRAPVGYRKGADRRLELDPETAPIVRQVFQRRAAGDGPSALADFLTASGVPTSQNGRGWSKQAVAGVLRNRVYLGEVAYGKDRRFVNTAAHPPLIDVATFEAAQQGPRRLQTARTESAHSLTGILRCAACGYSMQGTTTSRGKRIYRCVRRHAGGICPNPARIGAADVEEAAEATFWRIVHEEQQTPVPADDGALDAAQRDLDEAERRLRHAMTPEVQDAAGDEWTAMVRSRREERDRKAEAVGRAKSAAVQRGAEVPPARLSELWPEATPKERRDHYAAKIPVIAVERCDGRSRLGVFTASNQPDHLSRRGFNRTPTLHPIEMPSDARVLAT